MSWTCSTRGISGVAPAVGAGVQRGADRGVADGVDLGRNPDPGSARRLLAKLLGRDHPDAEAAVGRLRLARDRVQGLQQRGGA
jgi:hypothetical protein